MVTLSRAYVSANASSLPRRCEPFPPLPPPGLDSDKRKGSSSGSSSQSTRRSSSVGSQDSLVSFVVDEVLDAFSNQLALQLDDVSARGAKAIKEFSMANENSAKQMQQELESCRKRQEAMEEDNAQLRKLIGDLTRQLNWIETKQPELNWGVVPPFPAEGCQVTPPAAHSDRNISDVRPFVPVVSLVDALTPASTQAQGPAAQIQLAQLL